MHISGPHPFKALEGNLGLGESRALLGRESSADWKGLMLLRLTVHGLVPGRCNPFPLKLNGPPPRPPQ